MSHAAVGWAYKVPDISGAAKLVLVTLADFADENGSCFPSHKRLAAMTGLSERTVRRHIADFATRGLLRIVPTFRSDGSQTANRYVLNLDDQGGGQSVQGGGQPNQGGGQPDQGGWSPVSRGVVTSVHPYKEEPPREPPEEPVPPSAGRASAPAPPQPCKPGTDEDQPLLGEYVHACKTRPPAQVLAALGRQLRGLLGEGYDAEDLRRALATLRRKGLHPSALPAVLNEVLNADPPPLRLVAGTRQGRAVPRTAQVSDFGNETTRW